MRHRFVQALAALLCLGVLLAPSAAPQVAAVSYAPSGTECNFLGLINSYRASHGLKALTLSVTLGAAARHHSNDMAAHNYLGHTLYDGASAHQNLINYGYSSTAAWGENIYAGYGVGANGIDNSTSLGAFTWWKNSPSHNANMLSSTFKAIGIARAHNSNTTYHYYWTTDFGSSVGSTVSC